MPVEETSPLPLILDPVSGSHRHTIILLHGRGRTAENLVDDILSSVVTKIPIFNEGLEPVDDAEELAGSAPSASFRQLLPDARFVFPRARKWRATVYKRSIIPQWFDDWHLDPVHTTDVVDAHYDDGLQTNGLKETVAELHDLIAKEAALVGRARNVVLGGFSQGAAASLVAGILWEGNESLAAVVGMCAWLPYAKQLLAAPNQRHNIETEDGERQDAGADDFGSDPFERSSSPADEDTAVSSQGSKNAALRWLREEIELPSAQCGRVAGVQDSDSTPVLLCHGLDDEQVEPGRSLVASQALSSLDVGPVLRTTYPGAGHEFSSDMLGGVVGFLRHILGRTHAEGSRVSCGRNGEWMQVENHGPLT